MATVGIHAFYLVSSQAGEPPASVSVTESSWPNDADSERCFKSLKQTSLRRGAKDYASLREGDFKLLLTPLFAAAEDHTLEAAFKVFTSQLAERIKTSLSDSGARLNTHLITALERLEAGLIVHLYAAEQTDAQYIDAEQRLAETSVLNTQTITFGMKINLSDAFSEDNQKADHACILFRPRGDKPCNDFLEKLADIGDKKDIASETEALLQTVTEYTESMPDDLATFTRNEVVNYCLEHEKSGEPVVISELSNSLAKQFQGNDNGFEASTDSAYTPPKKFENFILESSTSDDTPKLKSELIPDKSKLRNFIRISGRNEQLSMSFSSSCLGEAVVYDAQTDSLIIKSIPSSLKARLIKHVQGGSNSGKGT